MPIIITADSVDEFPEQLRASAKEAGGKFVVSALPQGFAIENVQGLKSSLSEERRKFSFLNAFAKSFGWELNEEGRAWKVEGVHPSEAVEAVDAMKSGRLKSSKELDDYKKALEEKTSSEIKKANEKLSKRDQQLRAQIIDGEAAKHLAKAGGGDALRLLMPIVRAAATVQEDEATGALRVVLNDEHGRPLISKRAGNNDPMQFEEFVGLMREAPDLKPLFKIPATGGAGSASQGGGAARHGEPSDITKMSPAELMARGDRKLA